VTRAQRVVEQVLGAVAAAHGVGIVHRDLKPSNIMLVGEGDDAVRVFDFGVATLADRTMSPLSGRGLVGTLAYLPKEAMERGYRPQKSMDLYALGVLLYHMLAAESPWGPSSRTQHPAWRPRAAPEPLHSRFPEVPDWIDAVIARATAPDSAARYASAHEFRAALRGETPLTLAPGMTFADSYVLERELGEGPQSVVFLAKDRRIGRRLALKILVADAAECDARTHARFFQDAALAARVEHPGIVKIHAAGEWRGYSYFAMEGREAPTLRERWEQMTWDELVGVVREIADALDAVSHAGITHRDVSPDSILCGRGDVATLIDFGIARADDSDLTSSSFAFGLSRVGYVAREHALDPTNATAASDQWSLAAVVYEALTGLVPHHDPADGDVDTVGAQDEIVRRLESGEPPEDPRQLNASVPEEVAACVLRALAAEPKSRFPRSVAFATELAEHRGRAIELGIRRGAGQGTRGQTPRDEEAGAPWPSRTWAAMVVCALLLVAAVVAAAILW
jgi:serine/threonine-protein kinase